MEGTVGGDVGLAVGAFVGSNVGLCVGLSVGSGVCTCIQKKKQRIEISW